MEVWAVIKDNELVIPEGLADMQILTRFSSQEKSDTGILVLGENTDRANYIEGSMSAVRIYLMIKSGTKYHVEGELEAFTFYDLESAYEFLEGLPNMSALDLLVMMYDWRPEHEFEFEEEMTILQ